MNTTYRIDLSTHLRRFAAGAAALAALAGPARAEACGGFWCSQSAPVNQTAERILFVHNGDGTTTCVVEIAYQGPSERFAWLLPVAGTPEVGVSANLALARLDGATAPSYRLQTHVEGECAVEPYDDQYGGNYAPSAAGGTGAAGSGPAPPPAVTLLDSGSVGPYDYATISVNPMLAAPVDAAIEWLTDEGYDVSGISEEVLGPYLADGMNLIAFRLTKGNSAGSIRPVILTYEGDRPSIPIRPTAVAAQPDMGVLVWVAADAQAVPENYRSLVLNEALIDWFAFTRTYDAVVTAAANEAGGQGFVTEFAGDASPFASTVAYPSERQTWQKLQTTDYADPLDMIWDANRAFRSWDGWRDAVEEAVTLPAGSTIDDFGRDPDAFRAAPGFAVDGPLFLDRLWKDVVEPVFRTQDLLSSKPYLTRLYTTMSADEMSVDPGFTFNAELAPVDNAHTADLFIECSPDVYVSDAPWRVVLPKGGTVVGDGGRRWPLSVGGEVPANRKIVQLAETGSGEIVTDNSVAIVSAIVQGGGNNSPPVLAGPPPEGGLPIGGMDGPVELPEGMGSESGLSANGCGCVVPARAPGPDSRLAIAVLALAVGLAGRRRRG